MKRPRQRPLVVPFVLVVLLVQSACLRPVPLKAVSTPKSPESQGTVVYEVEVLEPGHGATRPVPIDKAPFQQAMQRLAHKVPLKGSPQEVARALLAASLEESQEAETVIMGGEYLAEVYRDRILSLVPLRQTGPVPLTPEAEEALRTKYLEWCKRRGGGDCLGLFDDGPSLLTDDRRTLALSMALGSVLDETQQALARELDPRMLVAMVVWTAGLYLGLLLVPEPTTKALAAGLTLLLVAWLGLSTFWELVDGWARLANRAHEATTFEELREAGGQYAQVLGTQSARAMILAVATLAGSTLGQVAARVRSMPGYSLAGAQWEAQGGAAVLEHVQTLRVAREGALAVAVEAVEVVATSPQGPLALVMLKKGSKGSGGEPRGGRPTTTVLRHRGGNMQVLTSSGQRWHLPRGKSPDDIPLEDTVGDLLQDAVTQAAKEWGPHELSRNERIASHDALKQGKYWLARLLEREARGRFVHAKVKKQFEGLYRFNHQGADVFDPATGYQYELLSGTESNLVRHGRRMSSEFFRMLTF
jgi:hypothetical protein